MLTPNSTYKINGVTVNEKIIPDGTVWKDDEKAKNAGFSGAGAAYKRGQRLSGGTGKAKSVTIHNTNDLANVYDDGEQYTRATYNENIPEDLRQHHGRQWLRVRRRGRHGKETPRQRQAHRDLLLPPIHTKRTRQQREPERPHQEAHPEGHRPEPSLAPGSQTGRGVAEQLPPENVRFSVLRAAFPG